MVQHVLADAHRDRLGGQRVQVSTSTTVPPYVDCCLPVNDCSLVVIEDTDNFLTADELFLDYVSKYMPQREFALFRKMLAALQQPQNSSASKLLDDQARSLKMSNWQAGVVSYVFRPWCLSRAQHSRLTEDP